MKRIKSYGLFENVRALTPAQIDFLNRYVDGNWVLNEDTGLIDVEGSFDLYAHYRWNKTKLPVSFGRVSGGFYCSDNGMVTLSGAPRSVGGNFNCANNKLKSLNWSPRIVGGDFYCGGNKLTSLEGAPSSVGGGFYCGGNKLTSLEGSPRSVSGDFNCGGNKLTSLGGAPRSVGGSFYCDGNKLTSLEGAPLSVGGVFNCGGNNLTSLEGAPSSVSGGFYCGVNPVSEESLTLLWNRMKGNNLPYGLVLLSVLDEIPEWDTELLVSKSLVNNIILLIPQLIQNKVLYEYDTIFSSYPELASGLSQEQLATARSLSRRSRIHGRDI
jgi:hypothetical protein